MDSGYIIQKLRFSSLFLFKLYLYNYKVFKQKSQYNNKWMYRLIQKIKNTRVDFFWEPNASVGSPKGM